MDILSIVNDYTFEDDNCEAPIEIRSIRTNSNTSSINEMNLADCAGEINSFFMMADCGTHSLD